MLRWQAQQPCVVCSASTGGSVNVSVTTIAGRVPLPVLIVETHGEESAPKPVVLFLHGKGEAGPDPGDLPKVMLHLSPPFRAITNELRGVTVVTPQAPRRPDDDWNWREHVAEIGAFLERTYPDRTKVAIGFSRGGLGVVQLTARYPGLLKRWAIVDPQRPADKHEQQAILPRGTQGAECWLRYGNQLTKNTPFSEFLVQNLPESDAKFLDMQHVELALQAFGGERLGGKRDLYGFLGLSFVGAGGAQLRRRY
jgi:pimeloyl-ACP methyl ester carboxylesterase